MDFPAPLGPTMHRAVGRCGLGTGDTLCRLVGHDATGLRRLSVSWPRCQVNTRGLPARIELCRRGVSAKRCRHSLRRLFLGPSKPPLMLATGSKTLNTQRSPVSCQRRPGSAQPAAKSQRIPGPARTFARRRVCMQRVCSAGALKQYSQIFSRGHCKRTSMVNARALHRAGSGEQKGPRKALCLPRLLILATLTTQLRIFISLYVLKCTPKRKPSPHCQASLLV